MIKHTLFLFQNVVLLWQPAGGFLLGCFAEGLRHSEVKVLAGSILFPLDLIRNGAVDSEEQALRTSSQVRIEVFLLQFTTDVRDPA